MSEYRENLARAFANATGKDFAECCALFEGVSDEELLAIMSQVETGREWRIEEALRSAAVELPPSRRSNT